jgi:hypothetical protein
MSTTISSSDIQTTNSVAFFNGSYCIFISADNSNIDCCIAQAAAFGVSHNNSSGHLPSVTLQEEKVFVETIPLRSTATLVETYIGEVVNDGNPVRQGKAFDASCNGQLFWNGHVGGSGVLSNNWKSGELNGSSENDVAMHPSSLQWIGWKETSGKVDLAECNMPVYTLCFDISDSIYSSQNAIRDLNSKSTTIQLNNSVLASHDHSKSLVNMSIYFSGAAKLNVDYTVGVKSETDLCSVFGNTTGNMREWPVVSTYTQNTFRLPENNELTFSTPTLPDIDADGDLVAVVAGSGDGTIHFFKNKGSRTSPASSGSESISGLTSVNVVNNPSISFVHIDSDGDLEASFGNKLAMTSVLSRRSSYKVSAASPKWSPPLRSTLTVLWSRCRRRQTASFGDQFFDA